MDQREFIEKWFAKDLEFCKSMDEQNIPGQKNFRMEFIKHVRNDLIDLFGYYEKSEWISCDESDPNTNGLLLLTIFDKDDKEKFVTTGHYLAGAFYYQHGLPIAGPRKVIAYKEAPEPY